MEITDPIHLPCPDMAGCVNPDPELTQNSLRWVEKLKNQYQEQFDAAKPKASYIPERFRQAGGDSWL
jgi:hypothetical protein